MDAAVVVDTSIARTNLNVGFPAAPVAGGIFKLWADLDGSIGLLAQNVSTQHSLSSLAAGRSRCDHETSLAQTVTLVKSSLGEVRQNPRFL